MDGFTGQGIRPPGLKLYDLTYLMLSDLRTVCDLPPGPQSQEVSL